MDSDLLRSAGEALYGSQWMRAIAAGLGPLHPDGPRPSIDDRLVRRWAAEERPIPAWVAGALLTLLDARIDPMRSLRERLEEAAT